MHFIVLSGHIYDRIFIYKNMSEVNGTHIEYSLDNKTASKVPASCIKKLYPEVYSYLVNVLNKSHYNSFNYMTVHKKIKLNTNGDLFTSKLLDLNK